MTSREHMVIFDFQCKLHRPACSSPCSCKAQSHHRLILQKPRPSRSMSALTSRAPGLANAGRSNLRSAIHNSRCSGRVHGFRGASDAASYQQRRRFEQMMAYCTAGTQVAEAQDPAAAAAAATPAAAAAAEGPSISAMDIRIGQIISIDKHPDADSLYVEAVDVGEPEPRTIVSGLVQFVPLEEMQNRKVVVLCNLQARNMRGVKSHGMLLCASNASHDKVEPLDPPAAAAVGGRCWFGSEQLQPAPETAKRVQKKKIWEAVQPDLKTSDDCVAGYKGQVMNTSAGPVTAKSLAGANIS